MPTLQPSKSQKSLLLLSSLTGGSGVIRSFNNIHGMASARIQLKPLLTAAEKLNFHTKFLSIDIDNPDCINHLGNPNICFIGKINHHEDSRFNGFALSILACVARLKALSVPICLIYCDHLAVEPGVRGKFYRDLLSLADICIVPCIAMEKLVSRFFSKPSLHVIEDPLQVKKQSYKFLEDGSPFHIGWFGGINNVHFVVNSLPNIMSSVDQPLAVKFSVLTSKLGLDLISDRFNQLNSAISTPVPWLLEQHRWDESLHPHLLESFLGSQHLVWIPSDPTNIVKQAVSHNRLVDSIQSGCLVVANKMSSYLELSSVSLLSSDYSSLINASYLQYNRLSQKYSLLRDNLLTRFQPDLNVSNWKTILLNYT